MRWRMVAAISLVVLVVTSLSGIASKTEVIQKKSSMNLLAPEEVQRARERIGSKDPYAIQHLSKVQSRAERWLKYTDQQLRDLVPTADIPRAFNAHFQEDPRNPGAIRKFGNYPWIIDPDLPYKVVSPVDGFIYPTNDFDPKHPGGPEDVSEEPYVDTGWGWKDPDDSQKYWFVGYYTFWLWKDYLIPATLALGEAYLLTGELAYAHKAAVLLDRIAEVFPEMDYVKQSRYGTEIQPGNYHGRILNHHWGVDAAIELATAYDYIFEAMPQLTELERATGKSLDAVRHNIEENLLEDSARSIYTMDGRIAASNNIFAIHRALATIAVVLDNENTDKYLDWVLHNTGAGRYEGIMFGLSNMIYPDGAPNRSAPGYNVLWIEDFQVLAELFLRRDIDLYQESSKLKRLFDYPLRLLMNEKFVPNIGDSGSVKASGPIGWNPAVYATAFRRYGEANFARVARQSTSSGSVFEEYVLEEAEALLRQEGFQWVYESDHMPAYGLAMLRSGPEGRGAGLSLYYGPGGGHGHYDRLNVELFAKGHRLTPDLGYPEFMTGQHKKLYGWTGHTISHNTVLVNERRQLTKGGGRIQLFSGSPWVQYVDVRAEEAYPGITSRYQRSVAMINVSPSDVYVVDVFRVQGGYQHDYSIHGPDGAFSVQELALSAPRSEGTLAGEHVPYGYLYDAPQLERLGYTGAYTSYQGSGFSYLKSVQEAKPAGVWHADWTVEGKKGLRISFLPEANTQVFVADGVPPQHGTSNPPVLKYVLARNRADKGSDLTSTFVTVLQPYERAPFIRAITQLEALPGSEPGVVALEITHDHGEDLVLQAIEGAGPFEGTEGTHFRGQLGVLSRTRGGMVSHAHLLGGGLLAQDDFLLESADSYTGRIISADYGEADLVVELDAHAPAMPLEELLTGQRVVISNEHHASEFIIKHVAALEGRRYKVTLTEPVTHTGKGQVSGAFPQQVRTGTPLPLGQYYVGQQLVNSRTGQTARIAGITGGQLRLEQDSVGLARDDMFHIYDFGPGDRFAVAACVTVRKGEDGYYHVSSNTTGRLRLWDGQEHVVQPGIAEVWVPTITVNILHPPYDAQVAGLLRPQLGVRVPPELSLAHLEIALGEQIVYGGMQIPTSEAIAFDTRALEDGQCFLTVRATDSLGKTTTTSIPLRLQNWWSLIADLTPPIVGSWFGDIDLNEIYEHSPGWRFVRDESAAFHDDPHRMTRPEPTQEYVVWESPALERFELTLYAQQALSAGDVEVAVSANGVNWQAVDYTLSAGPTSDAGWRLLGMRGELVPDPAVGYFRVRLRASAPAELQLGRVSLRGLRPPLGSE